MRPHAEEGLTLLETVIATALLALVLLAMYGLIGVGVKEWVSFSGQTDVQQNPRVAAERVLAEVMQSKDVVVGAGGTSLGLVKVTVLGEDRASGAASFIVQDASALVTGRPVSLLNLNSAETVAASAIAGTTVSATPVLSRDHRQGEVVRRGQTTLTAAAAAGSTSITVAYPSGIVPLSTSDTISIGGEGPFTVTGTANPYTISPALAQGHAAGEVVQPLAVVFQLTGTQLLRNATVLADLLAVPTGRSFFYVPTTSLAGAAIPGATQLCVLSVAGFSINDLIQVDRETYGADQAVLPDRGTVVSINAGTNCLTLDHGLTTTRSAGTVVRVLAVEINFLATQFNSAIGQTQTSAVTAKAALRNP
jgi:Tfp pilus assembly protein PilV